MEVILKKSKHEDPVLGNLFPGECFKYKGSDEYGAFYIVTDERTTERTRCVRLTNGDTMSFANSMAVVRVKAGVKITY